MYEEMDKTRAALREHMATQSCKNPGMLFHLQKTLAMLVMPLGLAWMLLLAMTLWSRRLRRPAFTAGLGLVWILQSLAGNPWVGRRMMARLERQFPISRAEEGPVLDAIFVLGGGTELDVLGRPHFGLAGDRVAEAARLWHAGRTRFLVASGRGNDGLNANRDLGQETRTLWLGLGVPDAAIRVVETPCFITREEIVAADALSQRQHWGRVGLLTSAYHLPRAMGLAKKAGLQATPIPCDFQGRPRRFRPQELVPQMEGLRLTQLALWEMVGQAVGR